MGTTLPVILVIVLVLAQAAAIDAWPHDTELAAIDDEMLVRVPGLITARRLDDLLACADAARAFFTQAASSSPRAFPP